LLVVVAIIALLISILLPSLGRARAQARTTMCASRIGQMAKSMLMYADSYEEAPPFVSKVTAESPDKNPWESAAYNPSHMETWLGSQVDMKAIADASHAGNDYPATVNIPRTGDLFSYARFETTYRCPEYERLSAREACPFNYTRAAWGRKYRQPGKDPGATKRIDIAAYSLGDQGGRIIKISTAFSGSALPMMNDEQWDRHIAGNWANPQEGAWIVCDPVFDMLNEIGQYHGMKTANKYNIDAAKNPPIQCGSLAYYDGHVDTRRDPAPQTDPTKPGERPTDYLAFWPAYYDMIEELAYAQLGKTLEDVIAYGAGE
jgi:type II secretory pathway pseudopilin PulG